jgi:hypothetical protein
MRPNMNPTTLLAIDGARRLISRGMEPRAS